MKNWRLSLRMELRFLAIAASKMDSAFAARTSHLDSIRLKHQLFINENAVKLFFVRCLYLLQFTSPMSLVTSVCHAPKMLLSLHIQYALKMKKSKRKFRAAVALSQIKIDLKFF